MSETGQEMAGAQRVDGRKFSHGGWGVARHKRVNECGHPEKRHYAKGRCRECYHLLPQRSVQRQGYYLKNKARYKVYGAQARERKTRQRRAYGITATEWQDLHDAQQGLCAICRNPPTSSRGKILHVDHDHVSGRVRGLLCGHCNTGIGMFKDEPGLLAAAIEYLATR